MLGLAPGQISLESGEEHTIYDEGVAKDYRVTCTRGSLVLKWDGHETTLNRGESRDVRGKKIEVKGNENGTKGTYEYPD